jgi:hypothetical protein
LDPGCAPYDDAKMVNTDRREKNTLSAKIRSEFFHFSLFFLLTSSLFLSPGCVPCSNAEMVDVKDQR